MNRVAISVLLAAVLAAPAAAQSGDSLDGDRSLQSLNEGVGLVGALPPVDNVDSHRFALQVHYFSYSRNEEWQHLKAAGLTDSQAVRLLLAHPPGTDLTTQILR